MYRIPPGVHAGPGSPMWTLNKKAAFARGLCPAD